MSSPPPDILHVEDDPLVVELVRRALRRLPHPPHYEAVGDAELALARLAAHPRLPRLLLLDLRLPRQGGLVLLAALRQNPATRRLPVVILSTSEEPQDVAQAYELGANSYLVKPFEYEAFFAVITQLVSYWLETNHQTTQGQ